MPISEELEKKVKEEASAKLFKVDYEKFYRDFTQSET
ncbi:site-specific recombinase, phage integrase family protein [Salmonella enterica subsp. houtenae serovar 50:g,z51:- str. 01-0133]|nr:site-specific recombinase, phage integrase family protein [Salmonella enterica subsp. houtenae serovar 50:g,z51:- str. 01-0133]